MEQNQRRYTAAENNYRQALDIYRDFDDQRSVSITAANLGIVLAHLGRHEEAFPVLLDAAVIWRQDEGRWSDADLQWLHREQALVSTDELAALVRNNVPKELIGELTAAIDAADNPAEDADPETADGPGDNP